MVDGVGGSGHRRAGGELIIGAGLPDQGSALVTFEVTTAAGLDAFAIALGSLAGGSLQLVVVDATTASWTATAVTPAS